MSIRPYARQASSAADNLPTRHNIGMSWFFIVVGVLSIALTTNAMRPSKHWQLFLPSFVAGWLTGELALFLLFGHLLLPAGFVASGALDRWPGWVGLALIALSATGLLRLIVVATRTRRVIADALAPICLPGDAPQTSHHFRRIRRILLPFPMLPRRVQRIRNIRYADGFGRQHLLDVYRPRDVVVGAPVLLQIHGGAWVIGSKNQQALPLMLHLAAQGWICVTANYRLSPQAYFPEHLIDCKLALAWVRENIAQFGGDPDIVVVTGGSAGGHLAALMGLTANQAEFQPGFEEIDTSVSAVVPLYGVYDMTTIFRPNERSRISRRISARFKRVVLGPVAMDNPEALLRASPISHVTKDAPPFFVIHGTHDNLVPVEQARSFVGALRSTSEAPVIYAELPGASHAFEIFSSIRAEHTIAGIESFATWIAQRDR